jgi:hypothetical protein
MVIGINTPTMMYNVHQNKLFDEGSFAIIGKEP